MAQGILDAISQIGRGFERIYEDIPTMEEVRGLLGKGSGAGMSPDPLINSIIIQESGGNPNAVSRVGAQGLMQIMPATAKKPGFGIKPLKDPFDPQENVRFGTEYFRALQKRFGNNRDALIAYNWGMGNTKKWLKRGGKVEELPRETRNYYKQVLGRLD